MSYDPYEGFADRYDLFFSGSGDRDPTRERFFRELFARNRVRTVLDCACGTGRDLLFLRSLGAEVWGSDISDAMLAQARKNLAGQTPPIPLRKVDYRELPLHYDRRFDGVVCLATAIWEMPDEVNVLRALASMRNVLNEGGILVLTQGTTDKQWRQKPRFIPAINTRDFSRVFVIDYFNAGARYNILDIFHGEGAPDFKVWSVEYHHILLRDDLERLLKAAGFASVSFYGSYGCDPYSKETSDHLIVVAVK